MPVTPVAADVSGFSLSVEDPATPGSFIAVFAVDKFSRKGTRTVTKRPVFGLSSDLESTGRLDETYTFSGVLSINDPGQKVIRDAAKAGTQVNLKFLMDGTVGYTRQFKFADDGTDFTADSDLGDFNMTASPKSDYTLVPDGATGVYF